MSLFKPDPPYVLNEQVKLIRLVGLDGTVCRIRSRIILRLSLAHARLRTREHFPETKICITANGALERRLTVDPPELLDPRLRAGPPKSSRGGYYFSAGQVTQSGTKRSTRSAGRARSGWSSTGRFRITLIRRAGSIRAEIYGKAESAPCVPEGFTTTMSLS
jgi:hypothetical protein